MTGLWVVGPGMWPTGLPASLDAWDLMPHAGATVTLHDRTGSRPGVLTQVEYDGDTETATLTIETDDGTAEIVAGPRLHDYAAYSNG